MIALCGSLGEGGEQILDHGIAAIFAITPHPCSREEALASGAINLRATARNVAATLRLAREMT